MESDAPTPSQKTILVVDDDSGVRTVAREMLLRAGYRVLEAHGCSDAVLIYEKEKDSIDLVLTDIVMPKMSGRDLANILLAGAPNLKIIFMSGYTDKAPIQPGKNAAFLHKPFRAEDLINIVGNALQG
ncbi:MAG TPA: response regulator [Planctomycetota bacterium]|jgi:CheY-like chemotaxis protein